MPSFNIVVIENGYCCSYYAMVTTEIVSINDPRVFLPREELQYQTLSDSLKRSRVLGLCTVSSATDGVLINIVQMPLLGIILDYSRFRTFFHPLKNQRDHRFPVVFVEFILLLVDLFSSGCVNSDCKRLFRVKAKVLSCSSNKVIHDVKPNELLIIIIIIIIITNF